MNRWTYMRIGCEAIAVGLICGFITYAVLMIIINLSGTSSETSGLELFRNIIQKEIGGEKEYRLDDGTRVDLLFEDKACEIDWANKWAEGIGQSIYYGLKTDRSPLVILLAKKDGWEKYRDRVEYCNIECWVYDTRIEGWVDHE